MLRKRSTKLLALALAGSLFIAACGDDSDSDSDTAQSGDTTESTEATETTEAAEMDIVETADAAGDFTTLIAAAQAAGLDETLSGEGPFTVFAPTDEAFEAALVDLDLTADELLADTELLTSVLTYHVVEGEVPASDVVTLDGEEVPTVNGASVLITIDGETVMVNEATVIAPDVFASNGVIHVIDAVLVPPAG